MLRGLIKGQVIFFSITLLIFFLYFSFIFFSWLCDNVEAENKYVARLVFILKQKSLRQHMNCTFIILFDKKNIMLAVMCENYYSIHRLGDIDFLVVQGQKWSRAIGALADQWLTQHGIHPTGAWGTPHPDTITDAIWCLQRGA